MRAAGARGHARARAALPRGGGRRRRAPVRQPRGGGALPPRARTICPPGRAARDGRARSARSSATCRCGSAAWTRRSASGRDCLDWHRGQEDLERVADLHRKIGAGLSHKGERKAGDRALPEGHQPAEGRPAADRAGAPLRGGRLALPPHRRQHARHLRVREGAAAGRAARRDARGQPRPRDLRARVRPHRRHREGAPEPRAGRGARARVGRRRDDPRAVRARAPARDLGGRRGGRAAPSTRRRSRWPSRWECCPRRSSCTPWLAQLAAYGADWERVERSTEASADARRARGARGQALPALRAARPAALARGPDRRGDRALPPRARAGRAGRLVRDRVPGALRAGDRAARPGRPRRRHGRARPGDRGVRAGRA